MTDAAIPGTAEGAQTGLELRLAALVGYALLDGADPSLIAGITAVAAGAILAMLADTMIPEAFEESGSLAGLFTSLGFLTAFALSRG